MRAGSKAPERVPAILESCFCILYNDLTAVDVVGTRMHLSMLDWSTVPVIVFNLSLHLQKSIS